MRRKGKRAVVQDKGNFCSGNVVDCGREVNLWDFVTGYTAIVRSMVGVNWHGESPDGDVEGRTVLRSRGGRLAMVGQCFRGSGSERGTYYHGMGTVCLPQRDTGGKC